MPLQGQVDYCHTHSKTLLLFPWIEPIADDYLSSMSRVWPRHKISVVNLEICQEQEHLLLLFSSFRCVRISIYTTFSSCFINSYWVTISVLLTCPQGTDWLRRERTVESYTWVGSIGLSTLLLLLYDYRRIANVHTAPADFIERGQPSHQTELRIATLILFVLGLSDYQHIVYFLWISSLWNNVELRLFRL